MSKLISTKNLAELTVCQIVKNLLRICGYSLLAWIITGCHSGMTNSTTSEPSLAVDCSGTYCGAVGMHYTGSGLGVWTYKNNEASPQQLKISLSGLKQNQVTLIFSNLSDKAQAMPQGLTNDKINPAPPVYKPNLIDPIPAPATPIVLSEKREWKVPQVNKNDTAPSFISFPSTLRGEALINGFTYKLWVADQEWTPYAQKTVPLLITMLFGNVDYAGMIKEYSDDFSVLPWGNYPLTPENTNLIPPDAKTINIILAPNGAEAIQLFDPSQLYQTPNSNQALAIFVGSDLFSCINMPEILCMDFKNRNLAFALSDNILHELTHLIHYYQRVVLLGVGYSFEQWLKEAIASSQGYTTAITRFPHVSPYFLEITAWFKGNYACPLNSNNDVINTQCSQNYYKSGQAFLLYLVQQYGTGFYSKILKSKGSGIDALDEAIKASGGIGFEDSFRKWGSMLALPDSTKLPKGYGYPGNMIGNYLIPALNSKDFAPFRQLLPILPSKIEPYSHLILDEDVQSGTYNRDISIPPQVAITVYVE